MSNSYVCENENDMLLYKRFRDGHIDQLSRWHSASLEQRRKAKDHDWNGAAPFLQMPVMGV